MYSAALKRLEWRIVNEKDLINPAEDEINLAELAMVLVQKLPVIIACAVVGMLVAGLVTYFGIAPKYKATSTLYVVSASNNSVVNLSDLQIGTSLTSDYKTLILTRPMMERTIKKLGLQDEMKPKDLVDMISIENPSGTRILTITVTSTNPQLAADAANEVANQTVVWLPEIMGSNEPHIAENAVVPERKSGPSLKKNALIGGMGLAMLCCAVYVVQYLLNDTIMTPEDMEKYFNIIPLATVPEDAGASDGSDRKKTWKQKTLGKKVG